MTSEAAFDVPGERVRSVLGAGPSRDVHPSPELTSGWFEVDTRTGRCWWSDGMFTVHALTRGEVVPTLALLLAHQRSDERAQVAALIERVATGHGPAACVSRLVGFDGRTRAVALSLEAVGETLDGCRPVRGTVVLLDAVVNELARRRADVQLEQALASRSAIDQAKGVLTLARGLVAEEAFDVLREASQQRNVRVRTVADDVLEAARAVADPSSSGWLRGALGEDAAHPQRLSERS